MPLPNRYHYIAVILLSFIIFSCSQHKPKQYLIGFSQCVESDAWRKTMLEEMKRELSFYPQVSFVYQQADGNSQTQIRQVREFIRRRVDILIISPNEADPLTPVVEEAFSSGIPVIIVDRKISSPLFTAYVGGDNYEIGKIAGEYAVNLLKGKGNIIEVTGLPKSTPAMERDRGFTDAIRKYPSVLIIKKVNGEWYRQKSKEELLKVAGSYPDVQLIFAQNDMMAYSAHEVYNGAGMPKPKIIGVDALPCNGCGMQFVAENSIHASMLYPTGGEEAIRIAMKILQKEPFKKDNRLQTTVVDSTNVRLMQLQIGKVMSQQRSIERQQQRLTEQERMYNSQRTLLNILGLLLVIALALGGFVLYSLRENKKINRKLQLQNLEISEQKDKLIEMSAKAQAANEAKVNFFTNISHEFRTPLTLILGPLEELFSLGKHQHQNTRNLNLIHRNVIRLLRLVNQLMDFRKIEVDKMRLRASENDLIPFVSEIMQSYKSIAHKRNIDMRLFTHETQLRVWFDVNMLDKVIFNLLSNAFKFTRDNGFIHVYIDKTDSHAIIKVEDNGIGMSENVAGNVFQLYYQGEYETHKGSGLGLALSKEFIKLHAGSIAVSSEKWKGTVFEIHLPLGNVHLDKRDLAATGASSFVLYEDEKVYRTYQESDIETHHVEGPKKDYAFSILVIEDNEDLRVFIRNKLHDQYEVLEADNGQSALQQAFDTVPDLIICDVVIPGKDGMALVKIFKTDIRTSHIPIILLTGKTSMEQQIEGMKNMADVYITKPFNVQFLEQTIKSLLSNRAMLKEHFTSELPSNLKTQTVGKIDRKFVSEFTSIVESNLSNEDFSVEDICRSMGVSRIQLYRKVKALMNINVNEYILNIRLHKAKYLLQHEECNISEIAYKIGFSSPAYFSTVFKSKFGVTPKAFKEK